MDPDERAREGLFMAFQYPVEIAGVNNAYFLKAALNAKRKHHGEPELDVRLHGCPGAATKCVSRCPLRLRLDRHSSKSCRKMLLAPVGMMYG
jgi:Fe-S cluster assembly ATPase SufC